MSTSTQEPRIGAIHYFDSFDVERDRTPVADHGYYHYGERGIWYGPYDSYDECLFSRVGHIVKTVREKLDVIPRCKDCRFILAPNEEEVGLCGECDRGRCCKYGCEHCG